MAWFSDKRDDAATSFPHMRELEDQLLANNRDRAWNAAWELIDLNDHEVRAQAIAMLRTHIAAGSRPTTAPGTVLTDSRGDLASDMAWQRAELALAIEEAIEHSSDRTRRRILASREVRKHYEREQARKFRESVANLGVRPGEGLPTWLLYMSRRKRKSWH